jgi:hypothetical protein
LNLHKIASAYINAVNPNQLIQVQASSGYTTGRDGRRTPQYLPPVQAYGQVQELTGRELRQLEMLNITGSMRKIYITGNLDAITRMSRTGGDVIVLSDNSVWLTTHVLEQWPDWVACSVTLQNGS